MAPLTDPRERLSIVLLSRFNSSRWQACLAALLACVCLLAVGWPILSRARAGILDSTRSEVLQIARAAAALVDLDDLQRVRQESDAGSPAHLRLLDPLVKLHRSLREIIYVYIAVLRDGRIYFQTGTDYLYRVPGDELPPDPVMARYPGADPELREALIRRVEMVNPAPVTERHRSYLSAYVPLFDANGGFHGVIGADMWAQSLQQRLLGLDRATALACALIALFSVAAGGLRYRQHRATQQVKESAARIRVITDHVPVLIGYIDRDERYRFCNGAFRDILGITPEQMIGRTVREVRGEAVYQQIAPHIIRALSGMRCQFTGLSESGRQPFHFHTEYLPDLVDGKVRGFYAMTVDVSAVHQAELKSAAAERTAAQHQLLSQLAASFSNRLAVVHGYLESIDADSIVPADLELTRLSLGDCLRLVEQLQLLAGYSGARFEVFPVSVLTEDLRRQWQQEGAAVPLEVELNGVLPMIAGNTLLLRSALVEVLKNASESNLPRSGPILLRAFRSDAAVAPTGLPLVESPQQLCVFIAVTDEGCGMPEHVLRRAADPFFSTRPGRKGLGLAQVAGIVRVHAGGLWVDSRPGQGTTVTLALPVR